MTETSHIPLLLSTAYFPPLEYFVYLMRYDKVFVDVYETYPKQTWRNRCRILSGNGPIDLTVPVEKPFGNHTKTHHVIISSHTRWQKIHWRSIESAYRNAPFFLFYKDMIQSMIFEKSYSALYLLNAHILNTLCSELEIWREFKFTEKFVQESSAFTDLRFAISPKGKDCKQLNKLTFTPYYQVFSDRIGFQPDLSILDLMFNLGPDARPYLEEVSMVK
ncbi:MAG: hypothetical protein EA393_05600 [Bacteroidetes bacterium]|nr:MAG: hypothetical protein EA393_05600 [Bacteroidota bacterium]